MKTSCYVGSLAATLVTAAAVAAEPDTSTFDVRLDIQPSGDVSVLEKITLQIDGEPPPLTRQLWRRGALLGQRVSAVADAQSPLRFRTRAYAEWVNVDLLEVATGSTTIQLRYTIERAVTFDGETAELQWNLLGFFWPLPVDTMTVRSRFPAPYREAALQQQLEKKGWITAQEKERTALVFDKEGDLVWRTSSVAADHELVWTLSFPAAGLEQPATGAKLLALARHAGPPLYVGLLFLLLAPLLRWARPRHAVSAARALNVIALLLVGWVAFTSVHYWVLENAFRGGDAGNVVAEVTAALAFFGFMAFFVWRQDRWLRNADRTAYFMQLALPVLLGAWLPLFTTNLSILFLPLIGLTIPLFWIRDRLALFFGVDTHLVTERVTTAGEIALTDLAEALRLSKLELVRLLQRAPDLPVVADFERGVAYSPEVAALKQDFVICAGCGGATETKGMSLVACAYCDREYASSRSITRPPIVPALAETLAKIAETSGDVALFWGSLMGVLFFLLEMIEGDSIGLGIGAAIVLAAIGYGLRRLCYSIAAGTRAGKHFGVHRVMLLLGSPLIVPAFALRALSSRRALLHFGRLDLSELQRELKKRGEMRFSDFATYLGTTVDEAIETARHLTASGQVAGIFDRVQQRLVHRKLYRTLAKEGSCTSCGGIMGVLDGAVTCHYCGSSAD